MNKFLPIFVGVGQELVDWTLLTKRTQSFCVQFMFRFFGQRLKKSLST